MAKKSYARQKRDAAKKMINAQEGKEEYFKTNNGWEDAKEVYHTTAQLVIGTGETIRTGFSDREIFQYFNKDELIEVNAAINGMNRDLDLFSKQLRAIYDLHADKAGPVKDEDEFLVVFNIVDQYSQFTTSFTSVVTPNHNFLINKLSVALKRREDANLKNPEVVSDVKVKDTTEVKTED
jgi:hypothetical protein